MIVSSVIWSFYVADWIAGGDLHRDLVEWVALEVQNLAVIRCAPDGGPVVDEMVGVGSIVIPKAENKGRGFRRIRIRLEP